MLYNTVFYIATDKAYPSYEQRLVISAESDNFVLSITTLRGELTTLAKVTYAEDLSMSELMNVIKSVLEEHKIAPLSFSERRLVVDTKQATWIPDHLFEVGNERQYLSALCNVALSQGVFTTHNEALKAHLVFAADNTQVSAFRIAIPRLQIDCQHTVFVTNETLVQSQGHAVMYINMHPDSVDIELLSDKQLLLSNTYPVGSVEEAIYYALSIIKKLNIDETTLQCFTCGNIEESQFQTMARFLPHLDLYTGCLSLSADNPFLTVHPYRYPTAIAR